MLIALPPAIALEIWQGPTSVALFLTGAVLIDIDHYVYSIEKAGIVHPLRALEHHAKLFKTIKASPGSYRVVLYLHTVETLLLPAVAALFWPPATFLLGGMLLHLATDYVDGFRQGIAGVRDYSLLHYLSLDRHEMDG